MKKDYGLLNILFFTVGIFIITLGKTLIILSSLGTDPWNVLYLGIVIYVPLSVGRIIQLTGAIMLFLSWCLKIKPTVGTFANMFLLGFFQDLILDSELIGLPHDAVMAWLYLLAGIFISGMGVGMYINGMIGAGPRDSFMLGASQATGAKPGLIKAIMEGSVVLTGWLLGGPVGLGTITYVILIGPVMQWALDTIKLPKKTDKVSTS